MKPDQGSALARKNKQTLFHHNIRIILNIIITMIVIILNDGSRALGELDLKPEVVVLEVEIIGILTTSTYI